MGGQKRQLSTMMGGYNNGAAGGAMGGMVPISSGMQPTSFVQQPEEQAAKRSKTDEPLINKVIKNTCFSAWMNSMEMLLT